MIFSRACDQGDQGKTRRGVVALPGHRNIGRGSCRSAGADGVGTPVHSSGTRLTLAPQAAAQGTPPPGHHDVPVPIRLLFGVGKHRGGAWVRQFSPPCVPPGHAVSRCSGPTRGSSRRHKPSDLPVRPRPRFRVATGRSGCSHRSTGRLFPCKVCRSMCVPVYPLTDA